MFYFVLYFRQIHQANYATDTLLARGDHFFSFSLNPSMIQIEELKKGDVKGGWSNPGVYMTIATKIKDPCHDDLPLIHGSDLSMVVGIANDLWGVLLSFQAVPA